MSRRWAVCLCVDTACQTFIYNQDWSTATTMEWCNTFDWRRIFKLDVLLTGNCDNNHCVVLTVLLLSACGFPDPLTTMHFTEWGNRDVITMSSPNRMDIFTVSYCLLLDIDLVLIFSVRFYDFSIKQTKYFTSVAYYIYITLWFFFGKDTIFFFLVFTLNYFVTLWFFYSLKFILIGPLLIMFRAGGFYS